MRKSKALQKSRSTKTKVTKRTTSRRAATSRSRTSRTARRTRRVSAKSVPPASFIELPQLLEQAVAATPSLPSKRYPIRNVLVLCLAFAATTAVGSWAVYVAMFGEAREEIRAGTPPVIVDVRPATPPTVADVPPATPPIVVGVPPATPPVVVDVRPAKAPSVNVIAPKIQDRIAAAPSNEAVSSIGQEPPRSAPAVPEVTAAIPAAAPRVIAAIPVPAPRPAAAGPGAASLAPVAAKGKRAGHPEATTIAPIGPGGGAYALVAEARRYLGKPNPTNLKELWCGAFVDLVLKRLGYKGGGNLASAYARYGTRVPGPQIGAIAVMTRVGGGHVGIVSGFDSKGRPIIISGNHQRRVAEVVYPAGRIYAYVIPKDWDRVAARTH